MTHAATLPRLRGVFGRSLTMFLENDLENILNGVSERNLCQRLSIPMETLAHDAGLAQYRADVEYNRANDGRLKTIAGENFETVTITCDLILHSRGRVADMDNLIAIEMKRRSHPAAEKRKDRVRLMALTSEPYERVWPADGRADPAHVGNYCLGYFVEIDERRRSLHFDEYVRGVISRSDQMDF